MWRPLNDGHIQDVVNHRQQPHNAVPQVPAYA